MLTHLHTDTPLHISRSMSDCESLAAASAQWAQNVPAKSALPVTHTIGRASERCSFNLLANGNRQKKTLIVSRKTVHGEGFGPLSRYKKSPLIYHQNDPCNQVMEVLVHPLRCGRVLAGYHINLTNCTIHIDYRSFFYSLKKKCCSHRVTTLWRSFNLKKLLFYTALF